MEAGVKRLDDIFLIDAKFPDQIFRNTGGRYLFFEYAFAFSPNACNLFFALSQGVGTFWCEPIDPSSEEYYQKYFFQDARLEFTTVSDPDDYWRKMNRWPRTDEDSADAIAAGAYVVGWSDDGADWSCFGHYYCGLCVINIKNDDLYEKIVANDPIGFIPFDLAEAIMLNNSLEADRTSLKENFNRHYGLVRYEA